MKNIKWSQKNAVLLCFLIVIVLVIIGGLFLRLRGSVVVKPSQAEPMTGAVTVYRQDDERWAKEMLGDSRFTMQSSGCLVACIASAVSMETGSEITPGALNTVFSENHVYDSEGNIQWAAVEQVEGYSADVFQKVSETEIAQCLAAGHYPIVRVRMHGAGNYHYVLIVGAEDGDYLCMDPLESSLTKLSQYWSRVYAVRVVSAN